MNIYRDCIFYWGSLLCKRGFSGSSAGEESACNAGDLGSIPGLGRFPGEGKGYPLQYACLENSMNGGAWQATVHRVSKSWIWLSNFHFHFLFSIRRESTEDHRLIKKKINGYVVLILNWGNKIGFESKLCWHPLSFLPKFFEQQFTCLLPGGASSTGLLLLIHCLELPMPLVGSHPFIIQSWKGIQFNFIFKEMKRI